MLLFFPICISFLNHINSDMIVEYGKTLTLKTDTNSIISLENYQGILICHTFSPVLSSQCVYQDISNSSGHFFVFRPISFYNGGIYTIAGDPTEKVTILVIGSSTLQCTVLHSPLIVETVGNSISCSLKFSNQLPGEDYPVFYDRFTLAGVDLDYNKSIVNTSDSFTRLVYEIEVRRFGRQHSHGLFNCQFSIVLGTLKKSLNCNQNFYLNAKPLLLRIVALNYSVDAIRFLCETDGYHFPIAVTFTWYLNGRLLRPKLINEAGNDVVIGYSTFSHERNLTCVGVNDVGSSSISFLFNLPSHPDSVSTSESNAPLVIKITSFVTLFVVCLFGIVLKYIVRPHVVCDREHQSFIMGHTGAVDS